MPMSARAIPVPWLLCGAFALCGTAPLAAQGTMALETIRSEIAAGNFDAAVEKARGYVAKTPSDARAQLALAEALEAAGETESNDALDRALELGKDDVLIVSTVADLFAARFAEYLDSDTAYLAPAVRLRAEALYAQWLQLAPKSALPFTHLAALLRQAGERRQAVGYALAAIARDTAEDAAHNELWTYLGAELPVDTLAGYYHALSLEDRPALERARCRNYESQVIARGGDAWWRAGLAARDAGDRATTLTSLEHAREAYLRAILVANESAAMDPYWKAPVVASNLTVRTNIVSVLADEGDLSAAKRAVETSKPEIESALRANPSDPAAMRAVATIADAMLRLKTIPDNDTAADRRDAFSWLCDFWSFATTLKQDDAEWFNNVGFTARECGRYDESYAAYSRCIELAPDSVRFVNDTALILLYHLHRDLDHAEQLLTRAVARGAEQYAAQKDDATKEPEIRSAYGDALLNLGLLFSRTKRPSDAESPLSNLEALDAERLDLVEARIEQAIARRDAAAAHDRLNSLIAKSTMPDDEADQMLAILIDGLENYPFDVALRDEFAKAAASARRTPPAK